LKHKQEYDANRPSMGFRNETKAEASSQHRSAAATEGQIMRFSKKKRWISGDQVSTIARHTNGQGEFHAFAHCSWRLRPPCSAIAPGDGQTARQAGLRFQSFVRGFDSPGAGASHRKASQFPRTLGFPAERKRQVRPCGRSTVLPRHPSDEGRYYATELRRSGLDTWT